MPGKRDEAKWARAKACQSPSGESQTTLGSSARRIDRPPKRHSSSQASALAKARATVRLRTLIMIQRGIRNRPTPMPSETVSTKPCQPIV